MALADMPADRIDAEVLRRALVDEEREGIRVEFKREVNQDDGAEWALDVSSFANTSGGVLVVGAEEDDGRLSGLTGLGVPVDPEMQRLESILRDRVDPALPGVRVKPVDVDGASVLVVTIPRSWRRPHLVRRGSRWQLARRNSSGKYVLQEASEIRDEFLSSLEGEHSAVRWHEDRVNEVLAQEAPIDLVPGPFIVLTVQPLAAASTHATPVVDIAAVRSGRVHQWLQPLYGGSQATRVNIDGLITVAGQSRSSQATGFAQLYRTGSLCYVDKHMFSKDQGIPGTLLFEELLDTSSRSVGAVEWAGAALPVVFHASLHGLSGQLFHTGRSKRAFDNYIIDRDRIMLPSVVVEQQLSSSDQAARAIKPMLDGLWNAAGADRCEYIDDTGNLHPTR